MRRTGFLYDERFMLHKTGPGHPEAPERLTVILRGLKEADLLSKLIPVPATAAEMKWVEKVHSPEYLHRHEQACLLDLGELDSAETRSVPKPTRRPCSL